MSLEHIFGRITLGDWDKGQTDEDSVIASIAHLKAYKVFTRHCGPMALDGESADLGEIGFAVLSTNSRSESVWATKLVNKFEDTIEPNLLIIDRLSVNKEFRGHKLGLALISKFIQIFGGDCGFCALMAVPPGEDKSGKPALVRYYNQIGFEKIKSSSDVMVLPLEYKHPTLTDTGFSERDTLAAIEEILSQRAT